MNSRLRRLPLASAGLLLGSFFVAWMPVAAVGADPLALAVTNGLPAGPALPDVTFPLLRILFALVVVLALFFGAAWLFRNWNGFTANRGRPARLRMLEMRSLGNRHALFVVGYEKQRLLVASSPAGITLLERLPPADEDEELPSNGASPNFADALRHLLPR